MADITGTIGAKFTLTISAATIAQAVLQVPGQADQTLTVDGTGRGVAVPNLPAGQSEVRLALIWAPGDSDAIIDVGTVTSGTVNPAPIRGTIPLGSTPGFVDLLGVRAS